MKKRYIKLPDKLYIGLVFTLFVTLLSVGTFAETEEQAEDADVVDEMLIEEAELADDTPFSQDEDISDEQHILDELGISEEEGEGAEEERETEDKVFQPAVQSSNFAFDSEAAALPGSSDNPYLIQNEADLAKLATLVNTQAEDEAGNLYYQLSYQLTKDLDLQSYSSWTPIGIYTNESALTAENGNVSTAARSGNRKPFTGSFDGAGYTISNLNITTSYASPAVNGYVRGLFGFVDGAEIKNLTVSNSSINCRGAVGVLVGYSIGNTQIENCHTSGALKAASSYYGVGGLIGYLTIEADDIHPSIIGSTTNVTVNSGRSGTGGLIGIVRTGNESITAAGRGVKNPALTIRNCEVNGNIYSSNADAGGLVGQVRSRYTDDFKVEIDQCNVNSAAIEAPPSAGSNVGGLLGEFFVGQGAYNSLKITGSNVRGDVIDGGNSSRLETAGIGGLIGQVRLYSQNLNSAAGSLGVGFNRVEIEECNVYTTTIMAVSNNIAGIIGHFWNERSDDSMLSIKNTNVYSQDIRGNGVSSGNIYDGRMGGLIGRYYMDGENNNGVIENDTNNNRTDRSELIVDNCIVEANVRSNGYEGHETGGLIGYVFFEYAPFGKVTITDCEMKGDVSTAGHSAYRVGGIVGGIYSTVSPEADIAIERCRIWGNVSTTGYGAYEVGGIVGMLLIEKQKDSTFNMISCEAYGDVTTEGYGAYKVGGVMGTMRVYGTSASTADSNTINIIDCHSYADKVSTAGRGAYYVGGLLGYTDLNTYSNETRILVEYCSASANVSANSYYIGGLIGFSENSVISGLKTRAGVGSAENNPNADINAAASKYTTIRNCFATGDVTVGGEESGDTGTNAGGLIGHCHAGDSLPNDTMLIENCYATGDVRSGNKNGYNIGGLIGRPSKNVTIIDCFATGDVYSPGFHTGGLIGFAEGNHTYDNHVTVRNCYAAGNVISTRHSAGGLIGMAYYTYIYDSYATGSVYSAMTGAGTGYGVGGLVGSLWYGGRIQNCYASGTVEAPSAPGNAGGFIGVREGLLQTYQCYIIDCWYDSTTTQQTAGIKRKVGSSTYEHISENGVSTDDISGITTSDAIDLEAYESRFTNWSIQNNISAPSGSLGNATDTSPWYIDNNTTYPYLYYQADGFNTDLDPEENLDKPVRLHRNSAGEGSLIQMPVDAAARNYYLGSLEHSDVVGGTYLSVKGKRTDYNASEVLAALAVQYRAATAGAARAYFPYVRGTTADNYNAYKFLFDSGGQITIPADAVYQHKADTLYSFGAVSQTGITAFDGGPAAKKTSDRPVWVNNNLETYTYLGQVVEYAVYLTNYSTLGRWHDVVLEDPLPKGVVPLPGTVFADYGNGDIKSVPYWDQNGSPPAVPYYTSVQGSEGTEYEGRYIVRVYVGDFEAMQYVDDQQQRDECTVTFKTRIRPEAVTEFEADGSWRGDNIRNRGTAGGKFTLLETQETSDLTVNFDDRNTDPVYSSYMILYNSNYDMNGISDEGDIELLKGYCLSDNSQTHKVLPNEAEEGGDITAYVGFVLEDYEFDGWFYYDDDGMTIIDVEPGEETNKVTRDLVLFAKWVRNETAVDFYKVNAKGQPLADAEFELYLWMGSESPGEHDLVTAESIADGEWAKVDMYISEADAEGKGLPIRMELDQEGIYQLVETKAPQYFECPEGQWRFWVYDGDTAEEVIGRITAVPGPEGNLPPAFKIAEDNKLTLINLNEYNLPNMGAGGSYLFILIGSLLVVSGFVWFDLKMMKKQKDVNRRKE